MAVLSGPSKAEKMKWQAEDDARTMAQYQEIMQDKARMSRAIKEANKQAQELNKRANAMKNAASLKAGNKSSGKKK